LDQQRAETRARIDDMKAEIEKTQKEVESAKTNYNVVYDLYRRKYVITERDAGPTDPK
jgi:peptidoglycan hydrolase CwlO-like protein